MDTVRIPVSFDLTLPLEEMTKTAKNMARLEVEKRSEDFAKRVGQIAHTMMLSYSETTIKEMVEREVQAAVLEVVEGVINPEALRKAARAALKDATKAAVEEALRNR